MVGFSTLADIEAFEQIPLAERRLPASNYEAIRAVAEAQPEHPALHFMFDATAYRRSVRYSYAELMRSMTRTANLFHGLGLGPGEVVSVILPNLPQTYFSILGGEAAGIVNPINPLLEPEAMAEIMNAAGTKILVTLKPFPRVDLWEKVAGILDQVPTLETVLQVDLGQYLTGFKKWMAQLLSRRGPKTQVQARVLDFDEAAGRYPGDALTSGRVIQPHDIASLFHTGGTTGTPKLAQHTHFNEVFDAWAGAQCVGPTPETVLYCGLPLYHVNGVIVTGLVPWQFGATVVLGTPRGYRGQGVISNFWKIVEHYRVNFFSGVPTVYSALLGVPTGESDVRSLTFALCGAAPMPVDVFRAFEQRTGIRVLEGYGLTEAACVSSVNPAHGERRVGSVGFRLPYQEMRAAMVEEGRFVRFCEPDEIGTILVRGPNVFPGYLEPRHNENLFIDSGDGQGLWLDTGDLGREDADGYFWITGRQKELIIRGGHNIDPRQIEEPLHRHQGVAMAAAVGSPDPHAGELPVAYVQLKPGVTVDEAELLAFARDQIAERAAVPRAIYIVEEMPLTTVGKIFKPALIRQEVRRVYLQAVQDVDDEVTVEVDVRGDRVHGTLAKVRVQAPAGKDGAQVAEAVHRALGRYTVHYELTVNGAKQPSK